MRAHVTRLMRSVRGLPESAPAAAPAGADADVLARELSAAFIDRLWKSRNAKDGQIGLLETEELANDGILRAIRDKSPDAVTFHDIEALSRTMPEEALQLWEEVKAAARSDLANGWHAARGVGTAAWDRASFLAIRDQLRQLFPPRTGVEAMLLDEMAQYELMRRHLIRRLWGGSWTCDNQRGREYPATAEMGRTIERLQRLFQYALRTLVAVRRANATAVVARIDTATVAADGTAGSGEPERDAESEGGGDPGRSALPGRTWLAAEGAALGAARQAAPTPADDPAIRHPPANMPE
jgi:hypothetical protein